MVTHIKHIKEQIERMDKIQLKQEDFIGKGSFANIYRFKINNTELVVKCFEDEGRAKEENAVLQKIQSLVSGCSGIIQYYGLKKLNIEMIGVISGSYMGYAIFFQACQLDFQKMLVELVNSFNQPNVNFPLCNFESFNSDILKNSLYSNIILALFEKQNIQLTRIHAQFNFKKFNCKTFHNDCDNKGSTLMIMQSNQEPNSFFGGMAAPP